MVKCFIEFMIKLGVNLYLEINLFLSLGKEYIIM